MNGRPELPEAAELRRALGEMTPAYPIDMVLHCPKCGMQHIDAPETDAQYTERLFESTWWELGGDKPERWTNPPHRSHLCHGCGHIWRPADVATNGVAAVKTRGKADSAVFNGVPEFSDAAIKPSKPWPRNGGARVGSPDIDTAASQLLNLALYGDRGNEGKMTREILDVLRGFASGAQGDA